MDAFVLLALLGVALLIGEMLLPTGGVLATLGAAGLIAGASSPSPPNPTRPPPTSSARP